MGQFTEQCAWGGLHVCVCVTFSVTDQCLSAPLLLGPHRGVPLPMGPTQQCLQLGLVLMTEEGMLLASSRGGRQCL